MSNTKLAALLRVTPRPATLAESSAIFKSLKTKARLSGFLRWPSLDKEDSACFYVAFSRQAADFDASKPLEVPVYDDQIDPCDEDPFNIRDLQDRKPSPKPTSFRCSIEALTGRESENIRKQMQKNNPFHSAFVTARKEEDDWLQMVMRETGAPVVLARGLGQLVDEKQQQATMSTDEKDGKPSEPPKKAPRLRNDSLVKRISTQ